MLTWHDILIFGALLFVCAPIILLWMFGDI